MALLLAPLLVQTPVAVIAAGAHRQGWGERAVRGQQQQLPLQARPSGGGLQQRLAVALIRQLQRPLVEVVVQQPALVFLGLRFPVVIDDALPQ